MTRRIEEYENVVLSHKYRVPYTTTVVFHPEWTPERSWTNTPSPYIPFPGNYPMSKIKSRK